MIRLTAGNARHSSTDELANHAHALSTSGDHQHAFKGVQRPAGDQETARWESTSDYNRVSARLQDNITANNGSHTHAISSTGGSVPHNIIQPYEVVIR